jgi:hypothetical protein
MGAVLFISLGFLFLLSIPIITSRLAKRLGRNPVLWFFLGLFFPVLATFVLFFMRDRSNPKSLQ